MRLCRSQVAQQAMVAVVTKFARGSRFKVDMLAAPHTDACKDQHNANAKEKMFIELFAGVNGLTKKIQSRGLRCGHAWVVYFMAALVRCPISVILIISHIPASLQTASCKISVLPGTRFYVLLLHPTTTALLSILLFDLSIIRSYKVTKYNSTTVQLLHSD